MPSSYPTHALNTIRRFAPGSLAILSFLSWHPSKRTFPIIVFPTVASLPCIGILTFRRTPEAEAIQHRPDGWSRALTFAMNMTRGHNETLRYGLGLDAVREREDDTTNDLPHQERAG